MVRTKQCGVWLFAGIAILVSTGGLANTICVPQDYSTIQAAINAANSGDTIIVDAGTYTENLNITKSVTISGVDKDSVILHPPYSDYGIGVSGAGSNVTIENITIIAGNARHFLIHVSGVQNFTVQNVKIVGAGRTATPGGFPLGGLDMNAVGGATVRNVELMDVSRNGIALTNSTSVTLENIYVHDSGVSSGWAGVAIYANAVGSFSVTFAGTNAVVNTPIGVYIEDYPGATVNVIAPPGTVVFGEQSVAPLLKLGLGSTPNLDMTAWGLGLYGKVYAPESPTPPYNTGVAFYATVDEALAAAVADPVQALYSVVFDLEGDRFVVGPGMQIQRALNASQTGDTVLVKAGTYVTQALIGKGIVLQGEPGAVIQAPGSPQTYTIAESSAVFDPIIFAYGGTLVGSNVFGPEISFTDVLYLTVDGQNVVPPTGSRLVGILYRNVHGTIQGNTIGNL
ncbi:MAG: right-handed parallel beta-helix repeat-containing protein, partial [Clostridia bacterium]|nr:right-handed parallel beta-helix repeat-containing protein [Clostridia bacterium]